MDTANSNSTKEKYFVVINDEEQYSILADYQKVPLGWKTIGEATSKEECLNYIKEVWVDMRPASLRKKMDASQ
ncbi:MAG: MbtH family NRPS accessory protein [Alphaproteobacteria bacterium]|nr:MbtH family NRPS accessory protein [Alphaproteobacteria bacterium]